MARKLRLGKAKNKMKLITKNFIDVVKSPEIFLSVQKNNSEAKTLIKSLYDFLYDLSADSSHREYTKNVCDTLQSLVVDDMDNEQIWQQIELQNELVTEKVVADAAKILSLKDQCFLVSSLKETSDDEEEDADDIDNTSDSTEESSKEESSLNNSIKKKEKFVKPSIVDDKFFKLSELEAYLNYEDEIERKRQSGQIKADESGINFFENFQDNSEDEDLKYCDFFDQEEDELSAESLERNRTKKTRKRKHSESSSNSSENDIAQEHNEDEIITDDEFHADKEAISTFEKRQERLNNRIKELEENAISEKPWQLKGEVVANSRPKNSLLEEVLHFDATTRPAPVITEETTLRLEDIIRQRVKDEAWDDVQQKFKPVQTAQEFRKQLVLDQEKSKESLAQVYENQYRNELEKGNLNVFDENHEELKEHKEIKLLLKSVFIKLDALSNFHYTPKPVAVEPRVITNTPAIDIEEVAPITASDAKLLAPEEVKRRPKGEVVGQSERTKTDKKRERRKKKLLQKTIYKSREERELEKQKLGIQTSKNKIKDTMLKNVSKHRNIQTMEKQSHSLSIKSSKAFFSQLQDQATVLGKKEKNKGSKLLKESNGSAKRLKL